MAAIETLEECISRLPAAIQNQQVSKLHEIAESFTNWQSVLPYLGLDEIQEESIVEEHSKAAVRRFVASTQFINKISNLIHVVKLFRDSTISNSEYSTLIIFLKVIVIM